MRKVQTGIQRLTLSALAVAALAVTPMNVFATTIPVVGANGGATLQIGNLITTLVGVTSVSPCINFAGGLTCSGNTSEMDAVNGSDSTVYATGATSSDTIKNLTGATYTPATPLVGFETVQGGSLGNGTVNFDLVGIVDPSTLGYSPCMTSTVIGSCSTGTFVLSEDLTNDVSFTLYIALEGYTGSSGTSYSAATPFTGTLTTSISHTFTSGDAAGACDSGIYANASVTIGAILSCEALGGTILSNWQANEGPATTPEPMTFALFGSGLIAISWLGKRVRSRS